MTTDVVRKLAIESGAVESPYSTALVLDSMNLDKFTKKLIDHIANNVTDFAEYSVTQRPRSVIAEQSYRDAAEQIANHIKNEILNC